MSDFALTSYEDRKLLVRLRQTEHYDDADKVLRQIADRCRFSDYCVYTLPSDAETSLAACVSLTNTHATFFDGYDRLRIASRFPVFCNLIGVFQPLQWCLADIATGVDQDIRQELVDYLSEFGFERGIHLPLAAIAGPRRIVSFSGRREALVASEIETLNYLVVQIVARLIAIEQRMRLRQVELTPMEHDCLVKAAGGLEAVKISREMGLSTRTVQYLQASVCLKLSVLSMDHAVAEALRLGIVV